jgi:hypothetical protein
MLTEDAASSGRLPDNYVHGYVHAIVYGNVYSSAHKELILCLMVPACCGLSERR